MLLPEFSSGDCLSFRALKTPYVRRPLFFWVCTNSWCVVLGRHRQVSDPRQQLALINGIIPVVTRQQQAALDEAARRSRDEERRRQEQEHWERERREQRILRRGNILAEASQLIAAEEDIPECHQLVWQQATLHNQGLPHRVETYL